MDDHTFNDPFFNSEIPERKSHKVVDVPAPSKFDGRVIREKHRFFTNYTYYNDTANISLRTVKKIRGYDIFFRDTKLAYIKCNLLGSKYTLIERGVGTIVVEYLERYVTRGPRLFKVYFSKLENMNDINSLESIQDLAKKYYSKNKKNEGTDKEIVKRNEFLEEFYKLKRAHFQERKTNIAIQKVVVNKIQDNAVKSENRVDIRDLIKNKKFGEITILQNKAPMKHEIGNFYVLNFDGRVTVASVKNFQIIHEKLPDIMLTFGKIGTNEYVLDYCWPFNPVQAFFFGVMMCDYKICCD